MSSLVTDIFILQTVASADQFDTITYFEDGIDLFGGIIFDAVTKIEQNENDVEIVSVKNIVARVSNTTAVDIIVADFVQPVVLGDVH